MGSRCDRRRGRTALATLAVAVVLTGCAPSSPDPQLTSAADDARSAAQTANLGLRQDDEARLFPTTASVVYEDMAEKLADAASQLEQHVAGTPRDVQYRQAALEATRLAIEGVQAAQHGRTDDAVKELGRAINGFERLGTG